MKSSDLIKKHPIYEATYEQMQAYSYAYLGGRVFKQSVRKKRPSEDSNLYNDLVNNTVAQPICRYIVDTINDVLFEPGVHRILNFATPQGTYINPKNCEWADLFLLDCDLNNRTLTGFMETVGDLTSIYGHCWVAVDMPTQESGNLGRPYTVAIDPLDVWDWEWEYYGGKPLLKHVKVKEGEDLNYWYLKCYYLGTDKNPSHWISYRVNKNVSKNQYEAINMGTFPIGMSLPIFIAYGRRDPRTIDIGISDIDSASDAQREYYKLECEAYTSIQFAKTIIRAAPGIKIPVHAGAIVRATEGQVETIDVSLQDVDKILSKQNEILSSIESLVGLGGLRNTKNQIASGVAIIEERKQLHRVARSKARLMETVEEMIFTYAARFMDMRWAGEVVYNTDYEAYDTNYRMAVMAKARELSPNNPLVESLITKEVIGMLAPQEEAAEYEQAYVNSITDPAVKNLMVQIEQTPQTRDVGDQTPTTVTKSETKESNNIENGAMIVDTGPSYYTSQSISNQINNINSGR